MSWHQHTEPDDAARRRRDDEYLEHYPVPEGSGSASSFATRHNEFPPGQGHDGAAHDRKTGEPVLGDGTPAEDLPMQWQQGEASGKDPAAAEVEADALGASHADAARVADETARADEALYAEEQAAHGHRTGHADEARRIEPTRPLDETDR